VLNLIKSLRDMEDAEKKRETGGKPVKTAVK
jgi:hypothetical protein